MRSKSKSKFNTLKLLKRLFFVACMLFTISIVHTQRSIYLYEQAIEEEIMHKINLELARQEELKLELEYNLSDRYIEKVAREQLGFVKTHEVMFVNTNN